VFDNLSFNYWDDEYSSKSTIRWSMISGTIKKSNEKLQGNIVTTRFSQAMLGVGLTRDLQLFGVEGKFADAVGAFIIFGNFTVQIRLVYRYNEARDWRRHIAVNPLASDAYVVSTGVRKLYEIVVGKTKIAYQLFYKGSLVNGAV